MATEQRLIDANDLTAQMAANFAQCMYDGVDSEECQVALDTISEAPTVDAVEVVRCKDCKHFVSPQGVPCCDNFYGLGFPAHSGDDFCSYGERRADHGKID